MSPTFHAETMWRRESGSRRICSTTWAIWSTCRPSGVGQRGDVDHGQVVAPGQQVEQGRDPALVDQRGQGDDQGLGRQGAGRQVPDPLPGRGGVHLGLHQGVQQPVQGGLAAARLEPLHEPAEADQADPVALAQVGRGQRGRRPDGLVQGAAGGPADVQEAVQEQDHVGGPLGVALVDHQAAAAGVALTLSGHTHGGQLAVPWFGGRRRNLAEFITPFHRGLYERGASYLYVNSGLGVTGQRIRLFTPREIGVFELRAS